MIKKNGYITPKFIKELSPKQFDLLCKSIGYTGELRGSLIAILNKPEFITDEQWQDVSSEGILHILSVYGHRLEQGLLEKLTDILLARKITIQKLIAENSVILSELYNIPAYTLEKIGCFTKEFIEGLTKKQTEELSDNFIQGLSSMTDRSGIYPKNDGISALHIDYLSGKQLQALGRNLSILRPYQINKIKSGEFKSMYNAVKYLNENQIKNLSKELLSVLTPTQIKDLNQKQLEALESNEHINVLSYDQRQAIVEHKKQLDIIQASVSFVDKDPIEAFKIVLDDPTARLNILLYASLDRTWADTHKELVEYARRIQDKGHSTTSEGLKSRAVANNERIIRKLTNDSPDIQFQNPEDIMTVLISDRMLAQKHQKLLDETKERLKTYYDEISATKEGRR